MKKSRLLLVLFLFIGLFGVSLHVKAMDKNITSEYKRRYLKNYKNIKTTFDNISDSNLTRSKYVSGLKQKIQPLHDALVDVIYNHGNKFKKEIVSKSLFDPEYIKEYQETYEEYADRNKQDANLCLKNVVMPFIDAAHDFLNKEKKTFD